MVNTTMWYFVAASFDASVGRVTLYQAPQADWPDGETRVVLEKTVPLKSVAQNDVPLLIGAAWDWHDAGRAIVGSVLKRFSSDQTLPGRRPTSDAAASKGRGGSK